jgi:hypothetical protein
VKFCIYAEALNWFATFYLCHSWFWMSAKLCQIRWKLMTSMYCKYCICVNVDSLYMLQICTHKPCVVRFTVDWRKLLIVYRNPILYVYLRPHLICFPSLNCYAFLWYKAFGNKTANMVVNMCASVTLATQCIPQVQVSTSILKIYPRFTYIFFMLEKKGASKVC